MRLQEWAEIAEREGRLADAAEHRQLWDDSMALFDQLVEVSGAEKMTLSDYEAVLSDGLDALQISLVPPGLDYVTLASFDQNSLDNMRGLYILGADAATMPRRVREQGIFSDADRLHIAETLAACQKEGEEEHTISRGGHEKSFGEKFLLYRGFTEAREYLWISYALADAEGNGLQPSPLVKKLRELFPKAAFLSIPLETVRRDDDLLLAAPRPALSGLANALRGEREHQEMQPCWRDVYNWAMRQKEWQRPLRLALSGLFAHAGDGRIPKELAEQIFATWMLSVQQTTGVYSPFTVEANYNRDIAYYDIPFTICHELSHLRGYMQEEEANFIGVLATIGADDLYFNYSGYVSAWVYAGNALARIDSSAFAALYARINARTRQDMLYNNAYWKQFEGKPAEAHEQLHDAYLKMQGQATGVRSYGHVTDLMLEYFAKNGTLTQ